MQISFSDVKHRAEHVAYGISCGTAAVLTGSLSAAIQINKILTPVFLIIDCLDDKPISSRDLLFYGVFFLNKKSMNDLSKSCSKKSHECFEKTKLHFKEAYSPMRPQPSLVRRLWSYIKSLIGK